MKTGLIKKVIAVVSVAVLAMSAIGCGSAANKESGNSAAKTEGTSLESIKSKGKLL